MQNNKNYRNFYQNIKIFDDQIFNLLSSCRTRKKQSYWEIVRIQWNRNRYIFNKILNKVISNREFFLNFMMKINLDINLIRLWKKRNYFNLCSTRVLYSRNKRSNESICRLPFFKRNLHTLFGIQNSSGCICCASSLDWNGPIWWDQFQIISAICRNIKKNKFFQLSFFRNIVIQQVWKKIISTSKIGLILVQISCSLEKTIDRNTKVNEKIFDYQTMKRKKVLLLKKVNWKKLFFKKKISFYSKNAKNINRLKCFKIGQNGVKKVDQSILFLT